MHGAYDEHRGLLARLADDDVVVPVVAAGGARRGWWRADRAWKRTYDAFDPSAPAVATLLFRSDVPSVEICRLEAFLERPEVRDEVQERVRHDVGGWLCLTRFPYDPGLPTLPEVLSPAAEVVRYRPSRRCTLRVADGEGGVRYAKVFPDARGEEVHRETVSLWQAAAAGELGFAVARPLGWEPARRALWQGQVPGTPAVATLRSAGGPALALRLGRAAATLPRSGIAPAAVLDGAAQLKRSRRGALELGRRVPRLVPPLERVLEALDAHDHGGRLRPIHGGLHPSQWLEDGEALGLVDFDRVSLGAPELDVATFLAQIEDESRVEVEAVTRAFVAGYESVAGPLDAGLLAVYRTHRRLSRATKAAERVRPDGDARAARKLQRVLAGL